MRCFTCSSGQSLPSRLKATLGLPIVTLVLAACGDAITTPPTPVADADLAAEMAISADVAVPGTAGDGFGTDAVSTQSLTGLVNEQGQITLSLDGGGSLSASYTIDVDKPAGATVRGAHFAAASTGASSYQIPDGGMTLNGTPVNWDQSLPSAINSWNHWADVTSIIAPIVNAAGAGIVPITVGETSTFSIDGSILAVIFDDPNASSTENSVILMFGAQDIAGDNFFVNLLDPVDDPTDPNLVIDMSLGISYGFQDFNTGQVSHVDVNGSRITSCAGGRDDGEGGNGALITVGGLGDLNDNPVDPFETNCTPNEIDDELYDLVPFMSTGDNQIVVNTINPSNDDNIFFAGFFLNLAGTVVIDPNVPPVATILTPADGDMFGLGQSIAFSGMADDAEDGPLSGASLEWSSDIDGVIGTGTSFSFSGLSAGPHTISLIATDSDGAQGRDQIMITVGGGNATPTATILAPSDGDVFTVGASIMFDGTGDDPEDGPLTGASLEWTSSIDGPIGTGESFSTTALSVGMHTITLTATDSDGAMGTDEIDITVQSPSTGPDAVNLLEEIVYRLRDLNQMGIIDDAQQQALEAPIRRAIPYAKPPVDRLAVLKAIDEFAGHVRALGRAGVLSAAEVQNLINMARAVIMALP
jgi:hypothetical protein